MKRFAKHWRRSKDSISLTARSMWIRSDYVHMTEPSTTSMRHWNRNCLKRPHGNSFVRLFISKGLWQSSSTAGLAVELRVWSSSRASMYSLVHRLTENSVLPTSRSDWSVTRSSGRNISRRSAPMNRSVQRQYHVHMPHPFSMKNRNRSMRKVPLKVLPQESVVCSPLPATMQPQHRRQSSQQSNDDLRKRRNVVWGYNLTPRNKQY